MSVSGAQKEFVSYIVELMQSIGPVYAKGMFGGHGLYLDELMFGLVADGTLYLKVDQQSETKFREQGLEAFTYNKKGKDIQLSYYQAPEEVLENEEEMGVWANLAYAAALRAVAAKRRK